MVILSLLEELVVLEVVVVVTLEQHLVVKAQQIKVIKVVVIIL